MAYMKECFIGINILSVQVIIEAKVPGSPVVLFLDFCKAFDSINHLFMMTLLIHIGFPPLFISWIFVLYR